jgi:hypothetical protein
VVGGDLVYGEDCLCDPTWVQRGPFDISAYKGKTVEMWFEHAAGTCCGGSTCNGEHRYVDNVIIRQYVFPEPDCTVGAEVAL